MSVSVVYLHPDPARRVLLRGTVRGDLKTAIAAARDSDAAVFCVISVKDLPALDALGDDVIRAMRPRQEEQIAQCTRQRRAILVRCSFTSANRGVQSLRAYQDQCVDSHGWAIVFLALAEPLYAELRRDALEPSAAERRLLGLDATLRWERANGEGAHQAPEWAWEMGDETVAPSLLAAFAGNSPRAKQVRFFVMRAAQGKAPVIVLGENGTGKEIVARQIHVLSRRHGGAFVPVNCSSIPDGLFESQMFGHKKGSFTGAISDHVGFFVRANHGTIFLDEIGDLSLFAQAKLLRVIAEHEVQVLGGSMERVDVRVVAATNKDIVRMVEVGEFRVDLFERLRGHMIRTPSLRSYPEDVALIAENYWLKYVAGGSQPLSEPMLAALQAQLWKGNVRELRMRLDVLHEVFGQTEVSPLHLDALLASEEGDILGLGLRQSRSVSALWLEHLDHVCRALDVIRSAQLPMRGPMREGKVDPITLARVAIQLRHRSAELESLCGSPPRFHYDKAFSATRAFKNAVREISQKLVTEPAEALRLWETAGEAMSEEAMRLLFVAMYKLEQLLRKRRPLRKSRRNAPPPSANPPGDLS